MKKSALVLTLVIIFIGLLVKADIVSPFPNNLPQKPIKFLMDDPKYKNLTWGNIDSLSIVRYTEAGVSEKKIEDENEVIRYYNLLKQIILLDETKWSCTDNTTIYRFLLKDGTKSAIEIECNWVVLNGKNYNFTYPNHNRAKSPRK